MTNIYNIIKAVNVDQIMNERMKRYQQLTILRRNGIMLRSLFKLGLDSYDLLIGANELTGLPLEVESAIDRLSTEQKEILLDKLIQKLGITEVNRIRGLAARIKLR